MAEVLATMKIMSESPEVDLDALKVAIEEGMPEDAEFQNISEEPIAFGLVALILNFTIEDGEGGTESTEEFISGLDDVASIEITGVGRGNDPIQTSAVLSTKLNGVVTITITNFSATLYIAALGINAD